MMYHIKRIAWIAASALAIDAPLATAQSADVGVLAAVNKDVVGERPSEQPRQLVLRERLILDERITTSRVGGGQVLFLDQTTLTLSPNSNILLDRYVYDPAAQVGDVSVTLLKGAMRFVGGRITKTGVATIKTPSATIGIRGGIGHVTVDELGGTKYLHIAGTSSTISNGSGTVVVTREGGAVTVPPPADGGGIGGQIVQSPETGQTGGVQGQTGQQQGGQQQAGQQQAGQQPTGGDDADPDTRERTIAQQGQGPDAGPAGGAPQYQGVATPETIAIALAGDGGVGDGGLQVPLTSGLVRPGVEQISLRISAGDGATTRPPISTFGEQQEQTFDEPPPDLGDVPYEEIADDNIAENIAIEIPQLLDGLEFRGEWTALAGLANGDFIAPQSGLAFELEYSLTDGQGVALVELPDTGDLAEPNLTTLGGERVRGDRFIVIGDEDLTLVGDAVATQLGGDATETVISIDGGNRASGAVFIDYTGSGLSNTDFIDGELSNVGGTEVVGGPISTRTDAFRAQFQQ